MCLIVKTQRDIPLTHHILRNMHERNPDGYGFAYVKDGELQIEKNHLKDVEAFIETYDRTAEYEPVFHLRMRTHGDIDQANTHPYAAKYGIWVMHNGVISFTSHEEDKTKSDTWHFIDQYLNPLLDTFTSPHDAIRSLPVRMAIAGMVGSNRLVLSDNYGHVLINTPIWTQCSNKHFKGLWVSNEYAWSGNQYKTEEEKLVSQQSKYSRNGQPVQSFYNGQYSGYASNFGEEENDNPGSSPPQRLLSGTNPSFVHIKKNLYADAKGLVWKWTGVGFKRKAKFDTVWSSMKARKQSLTSTAPTGTSSKSPVQLSLVESPRTGPTPLAVPALFRPPVSDPKAPGDVTIITPEQYQLVVRQELHDRMVEEIEVAAVTIEGSSITPIPTNGLVGDEGHILGTAPSDEEYTDILVREWQKAGRHSINGMVYTDPDSAARILEHILPMVRI